MAIRIKMLAQFGQYAPDGKKEFPLDLKPKETTGQVVARLGLPLNMPRVVLVNGRRVEPDTALKDGDILTLFPVVDGG